MLNTTLVVMETDISGYTEYQIAKVFFFASSPFGCYVSFVFCLSNFDKKKWITEMYNSYIYLPI